MERRTRRSEQEWQQIIDEQSRSGQPIQAYCESKSIGVASFYQWRRRLRGRHPAMKPSEGAFIEMGQLPSAGAVNDANTWTITLDLGDGVRLVLQRG